MHNDSFFLLDALVGVRGGVSDSLLYSYSPRISQNLYYLLSYLDGLSDDPFALYAGISQSSTSDKLKINITRPQSCNYLETCHAKATKRCILLLCHAT
jgi:hypothetical protein